jgi:hypothetical protein
VSVSTIKSDHGFSSRRGEPPPAERVRLLLDTGASITMLDEKVIQKLGLTPTGAITIGGVNASGDTHEALTYDVSIQLPAIHVSQHITRSALQVAAGHFRIRGFDGLLGRDLLSDMWFQHQNDSQEVVLFY